MLRRIYMTGGISLEFQYFGGGGGGRGVGW
jgi:hypothetical protein